MPESVNKVETRGPRRGGSGEAVVDLVVDDSWATPRTMLLSYELYAFAARNPPLRLVMQGWMEKSRAALGRGHTELLETIIAAGRRLASASDAYICTHRRERWEAPHRRRCGSTGTGPASMQREDREDADADRA